MTILLLTIGSILFVLLSLHIFRRWFNPLSLYIIIWYINLSLYELRLMSYINLSSFTWQVIIVAFFAFTSGIIIVYSARKNFYYKSKSENENSNILLAIFRDGGKKVKYAILITGAIGLFAAIQNWFVLFSKYGSLVNIFLHANEIYSLRVEGKLEGVIPYIQTFPFVGVFLSGAYLAYRNRLSLIPIVPFTAVILREIANFGRADMLFALFLFVSAFFIYRHMLSKKEKTLSFKEKSKIASALVIFVLLIVIGAGLVRSTRGTFESFSASTRSLNKLKGGFLITPSLYLYLSSHVGVLNQYFEKDYYNSDNYVGEITFMPIYNMLSKFDIVEARGFYDKGYFIPMWSNTATFLRIFHEDFGIAGLIFGPFALGLLVAFLWFKFYDLKSSIIYVCLVYLIVLIMFSFLTVYSRAATFTISFVLSLITVQIIIQNNRKTINTKQSQIEQ